METCWHRTLGVGFKVSHSFTEFGDFRMTQPLIRKLCLFLAALLPASAISYRIMAKLTQENANDSDDRDHGGPPSDF